MIQKKTKIVLMLLISIFVLSCSKYDEGPFISLRSPEKRVAGLWELNELMINDISYLNTYMLDTVYLRFSVAGEKDNIYIALVEDNKSSAQLSLSALTFNDKKDKLTFNLTSNGIYSDLTDPIFTLIPAIHDSVEWTIHRLTMNEMWLQSTYQNIDYKLNFSSLEKYSLQ